MPKKITGAELLAHRIAWVQREHEKAKHESAFQNGMRAGLDKALMAIVDGRDILGSSIDPLPRRETVKR